MCGRMFVVAVLASACGSQARVPATSSNAGVGALHCAGLPGSGDATAPAAVLYERNPWLMAVGSDFPTVALWRDGLVVFLRQAGAHVEQVQTRIPPADASRIADEVGTATRGVPPYTSVSDWSDQATVEIVVHDGNAWRVADIYGLTREGAPAPIDYITSVGSDEKPIYTTKVGTRPPTPGHFMDAYRELLALRAAKAAPFEPVDLQVQFWGFDHAEGDPVPWPADVPAPPADKVPADRAPGDPVAYSFIVAMKFAPSLRRALQDAHASSPPRPIGFNGHKWTVYPITRYRGQDAIDRVLHCNRKPDEGVRIE